MPDETILMPKLGLTMEKGDLIEWVVEVGSAVAEGDDVAMVATDKVEVAIPSPVAGVVTELLVEPGEHAVGTPLCRVETGDR